MAAALSSLSVLTIVKNRSLHFNNLVEGLVRSAVAPKELIVVDMSDEPLISPTAAFPIRVERLATTGLLLAKARNVAAESARGDRLLFLDVDCIPFANLVGEVDDHLIQQDILICPEVRYLADVLSDQTWIENELHEVSKQHVVRPFPAFGIEVQENYGLFWSLAFGIRADTFRLIGGFDERYTGYGAEDTDFAYRAQQFELPLRFLGGATACHQFHEVFDPPLQHFADVIRNARIFRSIWGEWPMSGWLTAFRDLGLVSFTPTTLTVLREPTHSELQTARLAGRQ